MKKYIAISISMLIVLVFSIAIVASESNIIDSMLFQGTGTDITFEKAVAAALDGNAAISSVQKSLEQEKVSYKMDLSGIENTKGQLEGVHEPKNTLDYLRGVTLPMLNLDYSVASAQRKVDATIAGQKAVVEQAYFSLLQASKQSKIQKENLDISTSLNEKVNKKYSLGLVSKQEVLSSELSLLKAQVNYKSAETTFSKAKMTLNNVLGYGLMDEINLKDELSYKEFKVDSIKDAIIKALENRDEIKTLEYLYKLESLNLDIIQRIYSKDTYKEQEQILKKDKAFADLENTKKTIELEVRNNYFEVMQKQDEIKTGEKSVEVATESLKLSQATYDAGMGLQTDVQKAQVELQQAKLGLSQAILDYNLAVSKFNDSISVGRK